MTRDLNKTIYSLLLVLTFLTSCNGQVKTTSPTDTVNESQTIPIAYPKLIKTQGSNEYSSISCGLQDKSGNLWFGTSGEGIYRFDGKMFTQFAEKDGVSNNNVWSICEDKNGNIWIGTANGLCRYDGNKIMPVLITVNDGSSFQSNNSARLQNKISTNEPGNTSEENAVWSIIQDTSGILWFGTTEGIYRYNGKTFTHFTHNDGISNNTGVAINKVESILEDRTGKIWFGGRFTDGLFCFDGNSLTNIQPDKDNWVKPLIEDKSGNIWFGTRMHSVYRYDGTTFTSFAEKELHGWVVSMAEDNTGNIWLSTEKGAAKFNGTNITFLTVQDGLKNDNVFNLTSDRSGKIWIGTLGMGLYCYDGKTITSFSE
ncbi:MAG: hypothetical protein IPH20_04225 [Bacteroidales bacterium]|nr:hypothetical protein [Bacteroidales bacterium]